MERLTKKRQDIGQRAFEVVVNYPTLWSQIITEWHQPGVEDQVWLMYSANYLFRTRNIRWAIDPLRLKQRLPDAPEMPTDELRNLNFILLTHEHRDHLDLGLLRQLKDFPILWVVPAALLPLVQDNVEIPADRLIIPDPMRPINIRGINIIPFDSLHWEDQTDRETLRGVPAMGYLIECNGKRWLFPGDIRTYDINQMPVFDNVDVLFAHLWLGRGSALLDTPPLLNDFCHFYLEFKPKRIVLAHLEEFGRDENDYWNRDHFGMVARVFEKIKVGIPISPALMGDSIILT